MSKLVRIEIVRDLHEPILENGSTIEIREGVQGLVLARYIPKDSTDKVTYVVEQVRVIPISS